MNDDDKWIIANVIDPEESRVAILEGGRLVELFAERMWERQRAGEIYKARIDNILPGMNAAFVNLGEGRNAFLYLDDAKNAEIKPNGEIIVQVTKVARKGKGPRVTARISLPGRYVVLLPGASDIGVSRRIDESGEKERLKGIARELVPDGFGVIVRTVASGVDEEVIKEEIGELLKLWKDISNLALKMPSPSLLYRDAGLLGKVLRDELDERVSQVVIDDPYDHKLILDYISRHSRRAQPVVELYARNIPIFEYFDIEKDISAALERKLWLPSGGFLYIDQVEAMTVIDVNTGKYVGTDNLRHTILDTNMEAAKEIARQLRLRSIGGIIIVDFIDMDYQEDKQKLLDYLEELFKGDRYKSKVYGVSKLGLVEITRKRSRPDLKTYMTRPCPFCANMGWVLKEDAVAMDIKRFLRKVILSNKVEALILEAHSAIAEYIGNNFLSQWAQEFEKALFVLQSKELAWDKYRLIFQGPLDQALYKIKLLEEDGDIVVYRAGRS